MATSAQPELENQEPQNQPEVVEPQVTTPTTPAPVQNNESLDSVRNLYNTVLQEANQREQRLQRELEELRNRQAQPTSTPEDDVNLLTTNPRELIRQEIRASVAPLQEQAANFNRINTINELKSQMSRDPRFPLIANQEVVKYLDQILSTTPQVDGNNIIAAYHMAVGLFINAGGNPNPAPTLPQNPQPTVHNQTVPTPPNIPTSSPRIPSNQNNKNKKVYSENEKLLMRINNMTEEEWEANMNAPASGVVSLGGAQ